MASFDGNGYDSDAFDCDDGSPGSVYWGPHFPDAARIGFFWGPHFPDGVADLLAVPPSTQGGAATFLLLESGSKLTLEWGDDVMKMWDGSEFRAQTLDDPRRTFTGVATLIDDDVRSMRAKLARFAAVGSTFLLALSYEAITVTSNAVGFVIPVSSTALSDWMAPGQRIALTDGHRVSMDAVIQSFTANSITIDVDPGALGVRGSVIVPTIPVYFDPASTFTRFRGKRPVEQWQLNARAATYGFPIAVRAATAAATGSTGALKDAVFQLLATGPTGNGVTLYLQGDGLTAAGEFGSVGNNYSYHYQPNVTNLADLAAAIGAVFTFYGTIPGDVLRAGDEFGPIVFSGGANAGYSPMGRGATVAAYAGRPVWDRGGQIADTATDSIQSLAELVDLGGVPISIGTAKQSDWGRAVYLERTSIEDRQWLMAFLGTVRGCQRAWWLSSNRADIKPIGFGATNPANGQAYLTVIGPSDAAGGVDAWVGQRDRLRILQADGVTTFAQLLGVVDNHDGTLSLSLAYNTAPSAAAISMVSWLELCRFDDGSFEITMTQGSFTFSKTARVVQQ